MTYIHLATVEWHSWTKHAASEPNVRSCGCVSTVGSRCFRMDASRADGQTVCGYPQHCGQREAFAALLPEPNRGPDAEEQSSVEHVRGMKCFLSTQRSFPEDTQGFLGFFLQCRLKKAKSGSVMKGLLFSRRIIFIHWYLSGDISEAEQLTSTHEDG